MKINFRDHNEPIINALLDQSQNPSRYSGKPWEFDYEINQGDIFGPAVDAFVSPANSMGVMDGGIDRYYSDIIGWHIGERLRKLIAEKDYGEFLVGEAIMVETDNEEFPYMISAPTMRTPRVLGIAGVENVFLATRAAVGLARFYKLKSIVIPGMGTGVGGVPVKDAAFAMMSGCQSATKFWNQHNHDLENNSSPTNT